MSMQDKTSSDTSSKTQKPNLLRRLDIRFPWLKLLGVAAIGFFIVLDLLDVTVSMAGDPYDKIRIAPMSVHVRVSERTLEGKKLIALTFDDGPSASTTPRLLDLLYEKDVPVTFFVLGNMARNNPDIIRRAEKEGHVVASHTMYHQNLVRISASAVRADIEEATTVITGILGHPPAFTRPPYGNINDAVRATVGTPMILWSVDTRDWDNKNTEAIIANALDQSYDGGIILMHDVYPTSVDAVPTLIDTMRNAGYEFVTIPELIEIRNVSPEAGVGYYYFRP